MKQDAKACDLESVGRLFRLPGAFRQGGPHGSGHINDTFAVTYEDGGRPVRYIHQRINDRIFRDVPALMQNVQRVTSHLRERLLRERSRDDRAVLTLIPARDGAAYARDEQGSYWRTYVFIEGASTYDVIETEKQAFEAARAFGRFQALLADIAGPRLHETIADFHHTPKRYERFDAALTADARGRAKDCRREIDQAMGWRADAGRLLDLSARGTMPERVTHNDTKLNNVMLDNRTGEAVCVIDLDTAMPGLSLYDFGDMVRTATNAGAEDERDLSRVAFRLTMFEALTRGYLDSARAFLTPAEVDQLTFAGRLLTLECGVRFLTDHLQGDTYFKIHREGHNLDRCRTQFKLVSEMIRQESAMRQKVQHVLKGNR
jgi:Ser/Thr protein kinase RdoA (MazF antagonist)